MPTLISHFTRTHRTPRWRIVYCLKPSFKESLGDKINHFIEDNSSSSPSAGILWEALKAFLRVYIIQYASLLQKQFEGGDEAGKMLARHIKTKELACIIPAIRDSDGQLHSDTAAINNTFKSFYMDLYS